MKFAEQVAALERSLGRKVEATDPGHHGLDFQCDGIDWDLMGHPQASAYWASQRENFLKQIDDHLIKADRVVVDIRGFNPSRADEVRRYVSSHPDSSRVIFLA